MNINTKLFHTNTERVNIRLNTNTTDTYKVCVELGTDDNNVSHVFGGILCFTETFNLQDYIINNNVEIQGRTYPVNKFNLAKFRIQYGYIDKQLSLYELRINKLDNISMGFDSIGVINFNNGYIGVDAKSSFHGNFEIDGNQYTQIEYGKDEGDDGIMDFSEFIKQTDLSDKDKYFKLKQYQTYISNSLYDGIYRPYYVTISGTNDDMYQKFFSTKEQLENELEYLKIVEPINREIDVIKRDYINS